MCVLAGLTRQELIDYFLSEFPPDAEKTLVDLRLLGLTYLTGTRKLVEAKGRFHVRADGITSVEDIPIPVFPSTYYRETGGYVTASPREIICALEGTEWGAELERAERLDEALAWLAVAAEIRGAIEVDEALRALAERCPDVDIAEVKEAVRRRSNHDLISIVVGTVDDREHFAAIDLCDPETDALVADRVRGILAQRKGIAPNWPSDEEGRDDILATSLKEPAVRAFIQYYDEHVPDDEAGLLYANNSWTKLVSMVRMSEDVESVIMSFVADHAHSEAQFNRLSELVPPTMITIPRRPLNGHSVKRYYNEVVPDKKPSGFKG